MFHTFEANKQSGTTKGENNSSKQKRRTSTVRACEPCRRRKIRCNGEHPCETCQWYKKAETCHYTEPRQRQVPYQRSVEKISATLHDYRAILQRLFPTVHPDSLLNLSRDRLVDMIAKSSPHESLASPVSHGLEAKPTPPNPEAGSLEALQTMPEEASDTPENVSNEVPGISDDVNALSLSVKQSSSYLGISSVMAALRVILWLDPEAQSFFAGTPDPSVVASREHSIPPELIEMETKLPSGPSSSVWDEIPLINAYFVYVHSFVPLIEEQSFRETYTSGRRNDSRWLALLNIVLAMGSIAASTSDDVGHRHYYNRAKQYLGLESLGSAHLETVQTLALMGGFYLHYTQEPTVANSITGAALRLAMTMGLHREYLDARTEQSSASRRFSVEMRRRVWWCLFNLDAWVSINWGRPSMGRWGHAITVKPPQHVESQQANPILLLQENVKFCLITTQIEDALAISPLIETGDLLALDGSLVEWYRNLPPALNTYQIDPQHPNYELPGLTSMKTVMRWRYHLARLALSRPVLLWYVLRRISFGAVSAEKQAAIQTCRDIATELIDDIASNWTSPKPCQMTGWNATWFIYQASMVPLLSLFSDAYDSTVVERCRHQVERVLAALADMRGWSPTASRSFDVVNKIYEASKRFFAKLTQGRGDEEANSRRLSDFVQPSGSVPPYHEVSETSMNPDLMMDSMWDSLNWSTTWGNMNFPFGTTSPEWEYAPVSGWGEQMGTTGFSFEPAFSAGQAQMHEEQVDPDSLYR